MTSLRTISHVNTSCPLHWFAAPTIVVNINGVNRNRKNDNWIDSYRNVSEKEINVSRRTNKIFKDTQRALFYGDGDENIINGDGRLKSE
jgi:hypothetical protein